MPVCKYFGYKATLECGNSASIYDVISTGVKLGGSRLRTVTVDGSLAPWETQWSLAELVEAVRQGLPHATSLRISTCVKTDYQTVWLQEHSEPDSLSVRCLETEDAPQTSLWLTVGLPILGLVVVGILVALLLRWAYVKKMERRNAAARVQAGRAAQVRFQAAGGGRVQLLGPAAFAHA